MLKRYYPCTYNFRMPPPSNDDFVALGLTNDKFTF